jgi:hypothetical protein
MALLASTAQASRLLTAFYVLLCRLRRAHLPDERADYKQKIQALQNAL